jgi:hypothetical protein
MPALDTWYDIYRQYFEVGCRWFELYDEPNLETSWAPAPGRGAITIDWSNTEWCIKPLMDNWLDWAQRIIMMGGYPAFPAMAETVEPRQATIPWLQACLNYLRENHAARFAQIVTNGLWCATHPYVLNHFYQEPPGGPSYVARPYYQQSAAESGWHFEYPYDPLQQRDDPGRTVLGGTSRAPQGDPNGLVATGQAFQELLKKIFDAGPLPVVGTAGGISPLPAPTDDPVQLDKRYPPFSRDSHAEATLAMWRWLVYQGPPWMFGLTLSTEAEYYDRHGAAPAVELMLTEQPLLKEVPDLEIMVGISFDEQSELAQHEPVVPAVQPVDEMPEPVLMEEPDIEEALEAAEPPLDAAVPPDAEGTTFEPIRFEEPRIGPWLASVEPSLPSRAEELDTILFSEPEAAQEIPLSDAAVQPLITPPTAEDVFETLPPDEPETATEMPDFDSAEQPPITPPTVMEPESWEPQSEVDATLPETFAPLPAELRSSEPPVAEEPWPEPEAPQIERVADISVEAPGEAAVSEPIYSEEPAPEFISEEYKLEPIPFEDFDSDEPVSDGPTIEMVLPELAWDYTQTSKAPASAPITPPPAEAPAEEPVAIDDLLPGPPPERLDYHFLMIAPGVSPDWLFQAALRYWQSFRPGLLPQPEMLELMPDDKSVAVTLLATSRTVREAHRRIHEHWPDVYIDLAVGETQEAMRAEMERRVAQDQRFGEVGTA